MKSLKSKFNSRNNIFLKDIKQKKPEIRKKIMKI